MRLLFKTILPALTVAMALGSSAGAAERIVRILAFGDSLTQGYGVPPGMDFPHVLEIALRMKGLNVAVVNAGVSGDTSAGGLARLDWSLADPKDTPDAAIVELGANDGLRGLAPAEMEKNLDGILAKLKARHIPVLLAGMKSPRNFGASYAAEFDAVFPRLAKKYGALYYPFFLDGVALNASLIQADGLHPNPKGVDVIVKNITPLVVQLVQQTPKTPAAAQSAR
ncbi:MAG TPA: arylesterase [Micropepsaceae bacterium]|nr:arylesterase [Micropepsaceae bacterium]